MNRSVYVYPITLDFLSISGPHNTFSILHDCCGGTKFCLLSQANLHPFQFLMIDSRSLLASASYDQSIRLWDVASGKHIGSIPHAEAQVNAMALVPKTLQIAVGTWQKVRLFDISSAQPIIISSYDSVVRNVTSVGFEPQARWMFSGSDDAYCRVYDVRGNQLHCSRAFEVSSAITSVVLHYNLVELFLADQSGHVYVWDLSKQDSHERIPTPALSAMEFVVKLAVHPKGERLAGITNRGNLIVWALKQMEVEPGQGISISPSTIATVKLFKNVHKAVGLSLRYSPNGACLAVTFCDSKIVVLDSASDNYTETACIDAQCAWNWDVVFSCDSRLFFTGGDDSKVKMWDLEKQNLLTTFDGHLKPITALCLSDTR